ncbi:STN domain-containing protein [Puniceicoccaceae bacterium K14]|nr:STN domain-containing protein [Puniceicoccaceae bacterium K14]
MIRCFQSLATMLFVVVMLGLSACTNQEKEKLDIPEGFASQTLKEFAKQANVEIIFDAPSVTNVRTNPVVGRMTAVDALNTMLSGTALVFKRDSETGAYAVTVAKNSESATLYFPYPTNDNCIDSFAMQLPFSQTTNNQNFFSGNSVVAVCLIQHPNNTDV